MQRFDTEDLMNPNPFNDDPDTDVHDIPLAHADTADFMGEAPTAPIVMLPMCELGSPADGMPRARVHSRELEVDPFEIPVLTRTRAREISDGVPLYVPGERARRLTKPFGSRGGRIVLS